MALSEIEKACKVIQARQTDVCTIYRCPIFGCGSSVRSEEALRHHLQESHPNIRLVDLRDIVDLPSYLNAVEEACQQKCPVCQAELADPDEWDRHVTSTGHGDWNVDRLPFTKRFCIQALVPVVGDEGSNPSASSGPVNEADEADNDEDGEWESDEDADWDSEVIAAPCLYCSDHAKDLVAHLRETHQCDVLGYLRTVNGKCSPSTAQAVEVADSGEEEDPIASNSVEHDRLRVLNFIRYSIQNGQCPRCGKGHADRTDLVQHIETEGHFFPAEPPVDSSEHQWLIPFLRGDPALQLALTCDEEPEGDEDDGQATSQIPTVVQLLQAARKEQMRQNE